MNADLQRCCKQDYEKVQIVQNYVLILAQQRHMRTLNFLYATVELL